MLDIKFIRENKATIQKNCTNRRVKVDLDRLLELDEKRRTLIQEIEEKRALKNQKSKGKPSEEEIAKLKAVGDKVKDLESALVRTEEELNKLMLQVPNLTHPDSPIGGEEDYRVVYTNHEATVFSFPPKDHESLLTERNLIDFERAAKVAGAKFYFLKNDLVRLNMAMLNYGMDVASKYGYEIMETPDLAKDEILTGVGFNPRGPETQVYSIENTDLSLIGTAEITLGGYHA